LKESGMDEGFSKETVSLGYLGETRDSLLEKTGGGRAKEEKRKRL